MLLPASIMTMQVGAQWSFSHGAGYGVTQATLLACVCINTPQPLPWQLMQQLLGALLPDAQLLSEPQMTEDVATATVRLALHWAHAIQQAAGLPVFTAPQVLARQALPRGAVLVRVALPATHARSALLALTWALDSLCAFAVNADTAATQVSEQTTACLKRLAKQAPTGTNTLRFLRAAHERGMPWRPLAGNVYEFGHGVHARWLDSSFTDQTSRIGVGLARNKLHAAQVLRACGLPAPAHRRVLSVEQALEAAAELDYPLVVKPMDCDGGRGVAAGLNTASEVEQAFMAARRYSKNILVEKHVEGRDYRLILLNGRLLWAIERQPGGIHGDGEHCVGELLDTLNADPRRGTQSSAALKTLLWDDEAKALLLQAGLNLQSIPAAGQFVRLRRVANIARGGMPIAVMGQVHPHNQQLAERAAQALRLDLAGVDLLIPDIAVSWQESDAAICEVNGQPQLGSSPHLYGEILEHLLAGHGRIPITLLIAQRSAEITSQGSALRDHWREKGKRCGYADESGVWLDDERLAPAGTAFFAAGQMLLAHRHCAALVLVTTAHEVMQCGLPFAECDLLIFASATSQQPSAQEREARRLLLPHARKVLYGNESSHWQSLLEEQGHWLE